MNGRGISIRGSGFDAEIIRTNRTKTATVRVQEGEVSIVVPKELPDSRIQEILCRKRHWIRQKLDMQSTVTPVKTKEYVSGESFTYLGRNYRLKLGTGVESGVKLVGGRFLLSLPEEFSTPERIRMALEDWYLARAETKFQEKVGRYAPMVGAAPKSVQVRSYRSRWSSSAR